MANANSNFHGSQPIHSYAYSADYYPKTKNSPASVRFAEIINGRYYFEPEIYTSHKDVVVSGKAEARRVAAEHNARCWNF